MAEPRRMPRWRSDLYAVLALAAACFGLSVWLELHERAVAWLGRFERWELDELPQTVLVLALGLAWYARRRMVEVRTELALRRQAEDRAAALLAHNRELAHQLIGVQERERLALARELHDELGQGCSAIRVETALLRRCARAEDVALLAAAARADLAAQTLYQQVRDLLRRLRPAELDALGLVAALQALCGAWSRRVGVACAFEHEGLARPLPDLVNITVYRIVQESLTNAQRHAQAAKVSLLLQLDDRHGLRLSLRDDGIGMDTRAGTQGLGLLGCSERAAMVGGSLRIVSAPGAGVQLHLHIPADKLQLPEAPTGLMKDAA
ncbi:sensor histidine kinase [Aquincola tertiaricarbonis]|uniref:sensor histidine kinase n=1 Tax=Aquincola tertiaricarbonis TaxID=391953 RepID=UPI0018DC335E|nr:sensor histidine kinase [Aquincola tertiaricarbonis]